MLKNKDRRHVVITDKLPFGVPVTEVDPEFNLFENPREVTACFMHPCQSACPAKIQLI